MSDVNINPNSPNTVTIQNADKIITVTDNSKHTEVDVTQEITDIVNVVTPGPQGTQGIQGPAGQGLEEPFTGSLIVSGSIQLIGDQTITGSLTVSGSSTFTNIGPAIFSGSVTSTQGFTGSLSGTASYADMATTASHALFAVSASHEVIKEVSSSHANTADVANGLQGQPSIYVTNITASGNISSSATITSNILNIGTRVKAIGSSLEFAGNTLDFVDGNSISYLFRGINAGAFEAYYAGVKRFETTATGVNITGNITASGDISASGNINATSFTGTFNGALSSSAQIATDISGAFGAASASFSTRVTTNEANITSITSSLDANRVVFTTTGGQLATDAGMTYNSTTDQLTVQSLNVVHLTSSFITASTIQTSGSNIFGDDTTDTQTLIGTTIMTGSAQLTGSLNISGSIDISMPTGSVFTIHEPDVDQPNRLDFSYGSGDPTLTIGSRSNQGYLHLRKGFTGTGLKIGSDGTFAIDGTTAIQLTSTQFKPNATNTIDLGVFNRRFKDVFLYSGAKLGWSANTSADLVSFQHIAGTNTLQATGSSDVTLDVKGDLNVSTNITASGNLSSSITSTASFGTYLGDGSQLSNISTTPFPFTGDAVITGSLTISGSFHAFRLNSDNIILGSGSGESMEAGATNNVIVGSNSGRLLDTGDNNILIGHNVGGNLNAESNNIMIGNNIADDGNAGDENIYIGSYAGFEASNAEYNVGIGHNALKGKNGNTGDYNTAIGYQVGYDMDNGYQNSLFGYRAGYEITTGYQNVFIGDRAGNGVITGNGNIAIGISSSIAGDASGMLVIGSGSLVTISASLSTGDILLQGDVSSSATSTASFGTYLGDGSQLTGIEGGAGFPFSGSAVITGSLVVSGSLVDFTSASSVLLNVESLPLVNPIVEYITTSAITSSGTTVPLPNALTFVSSSTYEYLEVFINGLRMRYDMDFIPASTASVTYQITVPSGAEVTYKSLKRP